MKKKATFLFVILLFVLYGQGQSQNNQGTINGKVTDYISGRPIRNVQIKVFKRIIDVSISGARSIRPMRDVIDLKIKATTNENGEFSITVPLEKEPNYFLIKANLDEYEEMISMLVKVENNETTISNFELTKLKLSGAELRLLESKGLREKQKIEIEKAKDYQNINQEQKKKLESAKSVNQSKNPNSILSCSYSVPTQVCVYNLINGYNSCTGTGCSGSSCVGTNCVLINFDDYIAGVVQGEIGFFSGVLEAKKAQAVAARTFSLNRYNSGLAVNCGQAYNSVVSASCSTAAATTSTQVILYNGNVIDAKYSARCNGDYTQNSENGIWSPYTNCNQSGSYVAYLRSKPCSGHNNCNSTTETPCCPTTISTSNVGGYIYGHGVGMCQRGAQGFASPPYNYDYCQILNAFYTDVCIANSTCSGSVAPPANDNCSDAISLTSATSCNYLSNQTVNNATASGKPKSSCDAYTGTPTLADVWYSFQAIGTSTTITVDPNGSILDAVIIAYNSCTNNTEIGCSDVTGGNGALSTLTIPTTPGNTYYIRIYDYGLQTTNGNFRICATHSGTTSCPDNFETNDNCATATNVFANPLGAGTSNYSLNANIGYTDDQDWFKVQLATCGTLTLTLSNLPFNYNMELYGTGATCTSNYLGGSTNGGTSNEQIIFTNTTSTPTTVYVKVYPFNPSTFSTSACYQLNFQWQSSSCCTVPSTPTANAASEITTTSLQANWSFVSGSTTYYLDVATNSSFTDFVPGYNGYVASATAKDIQGLTCNTNYYYRVRAYNGCAPSTYSNTISTATLPCCPPPSSPTANAASEITTTSLQANWDFVSGSTTYYLDVATNSNFTDFVPGYNGYVASATAKDIQGLSCGTNYYYRVRAYNGCAASSYSNTISTATLPCCPPPSAPTADAASEITTTSLQANWSFVSGSTTYYLDVATNSSFTDFVPGYNGYVASATAKDIQGLSCNTNYYYRVRAYNGCAASTYSNIISTATLCCTPPSSPEATTAGPFNANSFTANWNPVSGVVGYYLDVATDASFTNFVAGYNGLDIGNVISSNVTGLACNTTYYYRARAYNTCSSGNSNTITVTTATCLNYTFTGNGNWTDENNWSNNIIPPNVLPAGREIIINPAGNGECVLNVLQTISSGATLTVIADKKFTIGGNLIIDGTIDLNRGLVALYPFNGNANDESGNGNNGVVNGATLTTDRYGNVDKAYRFNGSSYFINITNPTVTNLPNSTDFTVFFYYNADNNVTNTNGYNGIISRMDVSGNGWQIGRSQTTLAYETGCSDYNLNNLTLNSWINYTFTFDRHNGILNSYQNGVLIKSTPCSGLSNSFIYDADLKIGVDRSGTYFVSGQIDDIRIYNRILSQQEINYLSTH